MGSKVQRNYKDRLFCMVFREKEALLSLYNAVNSSHYTDPEALEIVTLENAIYLNMKNDVAFLLDNYRLNMFEQQSSINPNMPLRNLFYVSHELEMLIDRKTLYGSKLVKIPTPKFVVFYNGTEEQPERLEMKLSDAFRVRNDEIQLELKVL